MKIILFVDFSSSEFNKDFELSNALLSEHTCLLVTSMEQLESAYNSYDILLYGNSIDNNINFTGINSFSVKTLALDEIKIKLDEYRK